MLVPTILTAVLVTCVSFIGALFFVFREKTLGLAMSFLTPFASGLLLGAVLLQMLPRAFSIAPFAVTAMSATLAGIIVALALSKTVWHHHHDEVCEAHTFGYINLLGEGIQNLVTGIAIASCFWVPAATGFTAIWLTATLAVILHSAVHQLGNFGFLLHGGLGKGKAMWYSLAASSPAVLGAVITYFWLLALDLGPYLVSFVAGWFIYVATEDIAQKSGGGGRKFSAAHFILLLLGIMIVEWLAILLG
jgi:zinc and cadmium transporter